MPVHTLQRGTRRFSINDVTNTSPYVNTAITNWTSRVTAAGGAAPSATTVNALMIFLKGLYDSNLYAKMININCFVPDNITAAITPLIATIGSGSVGVSNTWFSSSFTVANLSISGLTGGGGGYYLKTGVIPAAIATNNIGLTLYNTISDTSNKNDFGVQVGGVDTQLLGNYQGAAYWDCYDGGAGRISGTPLTNGLGYTSGNRISAVSSYIYKASSTVAHVSLAGPGSTPNTPPTVYDIWAFCMNNSGGAFGETTKRFSFMGIHNGLTATESSTFFNLIQTMRTNIGGGYV